MVSPAASHQTMKITIAHMLMEFKIRKRFMKRMINPSTGNCLDSSTSFTWNTVFVDVVVLSRSSPKSI